MISVDTMGMLIHALRRMTTGLMCGVGGAGGVGGGAYGGVGNGHGHHEQQQQLPQKLLALHIALLGNHLVLQQVAFVCVCVHTWVCMYIRGYNLCVHM